jgi:hypothetical protein
VAACREEEAITSVFAAVRAKAPAALICFKKDRLEFSLQSIVSSLFVLNPPG